MRWWLLFLALLSTVLRANGDLACPWLRAGDDTCQAVPSAKDTRERPNLRLETGLGSTATNGQSQIVQPAHAQYRQLLGNPVYFVNPSTVPRGPSANSDFGWTVVMNGNTMLVGADTYANGTTSNAGMVRIYQCEGTTCLIQSTIFSPSDSPGYFGQAIASVGTYLAVGAPAFANVGTVYLFSISNLLTPVKLNTVGTPAGGQPTGTLFGQGVAMYQPPNELSYLILAVGDTSIAYKGQANTGMLYIFLVSKETGDAQEIASFQDTNLYGVYANTYNYYFGYPVVQCDDWIATSSQKPQSVYVYSCTGITSCAQVGNTITNPTGSRTGNKKFGYMMALQKETVPGQVIATLVAGAMQDANYRGSAYVYRYNATSATPWTLMQTLLPAALSGAAPLFGSGVALSAGTLVVSAYNGDSGKGSLYVYYCHDGVCSDAIQIINCANTYTGGVEETNTCTASGFGNNALALSGTATFLAVGARYAYGTIQTSTGAATQSIGGPGAVFIYSTAPTAAPTPQPTTPSAEPTHQPSAVPTAPTPEPSAVPTAHPTPDPSSAPSPEPTANPTRLPTPLPTRKPSSQPTVRPSAPPTTEPTARPSALPTPSPTRLPSSEPTPAPTPEPTTPMPSAVPTPQPSTVPTAIPSPVPSSLPSPSPSSAPSPDPTTLPSPVPSVLPSALPSPLPSPEPSSAPTLVPTKGPTSLPTPTPSAVPTSTPTTAPSPLPSAFPSLGPTAEPSPSPTPAPSPLPTLGPTTAPTALPSQRPSPNPSSVPTAEPSAAPTARPTAQPSAHPTPQPTPSPTPDPTTGPTGQPSGQPTAQPSTQPSAQPSSRPSTRPTSQPSGQPSGQPSRQLLLLLPQQQTLIDSMVYGSNRAYFYTALAVLVVLMCACFWACRYYRQRIDATDQRTPYEVWVDYHEAKRTGADYVPPQHVANPLPPQTVLPGYSDPDKHASTFRRASMRMLGLGRPISGTNLRPANGTSRLDPSHGADASIYDASGTNARVSEMGLHDLYGRRSEGLATLGARAAPTAMRNLDRLDDAYSPNGMGPAGHTNPADLTTLENDPQVTAATAMALAAQQISSTKKKASNTFAAYNPLIVGMGNVERDRGGKRASTTTSSSSSTTTTTGALTTDPIPKVVDAAATSTSSTNTISSSISSSAAGPDGSSFLVSSPILSATTTAQEYSPRPVSMIRPHSVLLSSRGAAGGGAGAGGGGGGGGGRGFSQPSDDRRGSSKRLQLSPQAAPGASTSYPLGTPLQSLESLAVAARLSTIHFHENEEEEDGL